MTNKKLLFFTPILIAVFMAAGMILGSAVHTNTNIAGIPQVHACDSVPSDTECWDSDSYGGWHCETHYVEINCDSGGGGSTGPTPPPSYCTPQCGEQCGEEQTCGGAPTGVICGSPTNAWCQEPCTCSDGTACPNGLDGQPDANQCGYVCQPLGCANTCGNTLQCGEVVDCGLCPSTFCNGHPENCTTTCANTRTCPNPNPGGCPAGTEWNGVDNCDPVPPPQTCPDDSTTDIGCPDGYTGHDYQTTEYYPYPSCSPHYSYDNQCVQQGSCQNPTQEDLGCPDGQVGTNIQTTTYSPYPACTPHSTTDTECTPVTTTMTITSNAPAGWSVNPGGFAGTGSTQVHPNPSSSGTLYTITPQPVAGYSYPPVVTNTVTGTGSSYVLYPGQTEGFILTFTQLFDYTLSHGSMDPIMKGGVDQFGQIQITKTLTTGTTQPVSLSLSGVPSGVDTSMSSGGVCNPTCTNTITFTVHPSATSGTYPITVTGASPVHTTNFNLVIQDSPAVVVSCTAGPSPARIGDAVTWTGQVSGGIPPYTYVWSGTGIPTDPAPTTNPYTVTYTTIGPKTAQLQVTDHLGNVGICGSGGSGGGGGGGGNGPSSTVQINFNPQFQEF